MKTLWAKATVISIGLAIISLIFIAQANAKVDPQLAVGVWLLDEGTGDEIKDITENANDGILQNDPKWVNGKIDKCLEFDGKGSFAMIANTESLEISDFITIVAWVHPYFYGQSGEKKPNTASGASVNILSKMASANSYTGPFWWEYRNNGQMNAYFAAPPADAYLNPTIPNLPVDEWSHVAATFNSKDGVANVYLNGVVAQTSTNKSFGQLRVGVELLIGTGKGGGDYGKPFDGMIDEVAIFHATLDGDNINDIMNNGLQRVLGLAAVSPTGRLASTWAKIKAH